MLRGMLFLLFGYGMGSIMYGYLLPMWTKQINVVALSKDHNPGAANVIKYAGAPMGIACLILDLGKGYIPIRCALHWISPDGIWFALVMAAPVLGHAFPFWRHIPGGKAIAVSFGVLLGIVPVGQGFFWLAILYIGFVLIRTIRPNEKKSVYAFASLSILSLLGLFLGDFPGICLGNVLIALIVIEKNRKDAFS